MGRNEPYEVDLDGHTLPDWMSPLEAHKDNLTILQGFSARGVQQPNYAFGSPSIAVDEISSATAR